jgi:hypothetical protein
MSGSLGRERVTAARQLLGFRHRQLDRPRPPAGLPTSDFSGFLLALVDPLQKLFDQFAESFRDRLRNIDMCLDFLSDELTKLTSTYRFV